MARSEMIKVIMPFKPAYIVIDSKPEIIDAYALRNGMHAYHILYKYQRSFYPFRIISNTNIKKERSFYAVASIRIWKTIVHGCSVNITELYAIKNEKVKGTKRLIAVLDSIHSKQATEAAEALASRKTGKLIKIHSTSALSNDYVALYVGHIGLLLLFKSL